ncbi:dihydroorotase [Lentilactobacillus kosonis]|uniref:Dihydroorotase n=1 Tax=Lentilactobacillus kosonis TaxID=2810561 RepID=A0A401FJ10_9LACO|nr:dihydroorotase [Lentilactobacillus kosonis]GAY72339.1 dihydroorotase [Lentilactobacillus kosonis]
MKTLIAHGKLLVDDQLISQNVLIENGLVTAITMPDQVVDADQAIDVEGKFVSPGLVDVHVHYREPGFNDKETIRTGTMAAAHGGYTTVGAMPNLDPTPDTVEHLTDQIKLNKDKGLIKVLQYATITENRRGNQLVDFTGLKQAGAFAFSNDGSGIQTSETMYQAMQEIAKLGMSLVAHVEDSSLSANGALAEEAAQRIGVKPIPWVSETAQVARDLTLAEATGVHYHVCHVSSKHTVEIIREAKRRGVNVTCEVTPHHLLLTEDNIIEDNSLFKMNPPLRSQSDRQALIGGLLDGTIDMIATDHAPHTYEQKKQPISDAPFGITGSETAFSMLYTYFVRTGIFTLGQLINWMALRPAQVFKLATAGKLAVGLPADIAVFDLNHEGEIKVTEFASKGKNSPFIGEKVFGQTVLTMVDGQVVYQ